MAGSGLGPVSDTLFILPNRAHGLLTSMTLPVGSSKNIFLFSGEVSDRRAAARCDALLCVQCDDHDGKKVSAR